MIILGIDPGLRNTGWGVIDLNSSNRQMRHLGHGVISTSKELSLDKRILAIYTEIHTLIQTHKPQMLANEALLFQKNVSSALPVAHARGAVLLLAAQHQLEVASYAPNTIKQAVTGNGRATKEMVQQMVKILLKLASAPKSDHAADALAAAITAAYGTPVVSEALT